MNMRQVWGVAGGFFFVFILITLTNKPHVTPRSADTPAPGASVAPEDQAMSPGSSPVAAAAQGGRLRGFNLLPADGHSLGGDDAKTALQALASNGGSSVSLAPIISQPTGSSAEVPADPSASLVVDDARKAVQAAKAAGLQVMLRPTVLGQDGAKRDGIAPPDPEVWVASYARALQPFLAMAEAEQVELVCLGARLDKVQGAEAWKKLIAGARDTYKGKLTYASSPAADTGYGHVKFWADLDFVGVDAFFPLTSVTGPQAKDLEGGWTEVANTLEAWRGSDAGAKPILFTSAGVPRLVGAAARPDQPDMSAPDDEKVQAAAYDAFFKTIWQRTWLAGVFWHDWPVAGDGHDPYALAGHPALDVVRANFQGVGQ